MGPRAACAFRAGCALDAVADDELVARFWEGDEDALAALLGRYRGLVQVKARSYFVLGAEREDVVQEGMIGLYKAVRDYDPARQVSFRAFADLCATRQIITAVKNATRRKHAPLNSYVSLHLPASSEDAHRELLDSLVCAALDPAESVVSAQELQLLARYFDGSLSPFETEVLERYVVGATYSEIADELDRHVKAIDNALQRIKRKLDSYLRRRRLEELEEAV